MQLERYSGKLAIAAGLVAIFVGHCGAAPSEATRVRNLEILAQVWGRLYLLHPRLASDAVDWNSALIATIPKAEQAETPEALIAVLNTSLFPALADPLTIAQKNTVSPNRLFDGMWGFYISGLKIGAARRGAPGSPPQPVNIRRLSSSLALLDASDPDDFVQPDSFARLDDALKQAESADTVIVDLWFPKLAIANLDWLRAFLESPQNTGGWVTTRRMA